MKKSLVTISIVKKTVMALTGLFLCFFLVVHLLGNLQLLLPKDQALKMFNSYSQFMSTNPLIQIASKITMAFFLLHTFMAIALEIKNYRSRPEKYVYGNASSVVTLFSKFMLEFGIVIFVFLIIHLKSFWYEVHFGKLPLDADGNKDLYTLTITAFKDFWYVALYIVSMAALAFHLLHGFQSAFRTTGLARNPKILCVIKAAGKGFSVLICGLFALIPIFIYFFR